MVAQSVAKNASAPFALLGKAWDSTVSADVYKAWQVADHDGWNPPLRFPAR